MKKRLISFILIFIPMLSNADSACQSPKTSYDQTYCTAKLFIESDKELNITYNELKNILNAEGKNSLLHAQRAWLKYRDQHCSTGDTIEVDCNFSLNKARDEFLRDRLRECKTGQCRNDLVASQHFDEKA